MAKFIQIDIEKARALKSQGMSYTAIAKVFKTSCQTIMCRLDPVYHAKRKERNNSRRRFHMGSSLSEYVQSPRRVADEVVAARLAEIPQDTRTPTQRLMGDPVFERSALFQKRVYR